MKDIYITWEDYHKKIEQLAKKVYEDNWKLFDTSGNKLADNDYKFCKNKAMTSLKIRKITN